VDDGHVYLAVPKTEKATGMVKTNRFGRRHFRFIAIPLVLIAALFLL
jgi:hypothetical protein